MSSRSSSSITSSSAASVGQGQQLLLGHERAPLEALAGQHHVGEPDQGPGHAGAAARSARARRPGPRPAAPPASGCWIAHVLGAASASTKTTPRSATGATTTPHGAEEAVGEHAVERGLDQLADEHHQQQRVEEPLGSLDQLEEARGAAVAVLGRAVGAVAGPSGSAPSRPARGTPSDQQHDDRRDRVTTSSVGVGQWRGSRRAASVRHHGAGTPSRPVQVGASRSDAPGALHGGAPRPASAWSCPSRCRMPWTTSSATRRRGCRRGRRVAVRDRRADDHVAEQQRHVLEVVRAGTGRRATGRAGWPRRRSGTRARRSGPRGPRRSFSSAMVASSTNSTDSSHAPATPSAPRAPRRPGPASGRRRPAPARRPRTR